MESLENNPIGEIAARIRQVRKHLGLEQQELAAKLGVAVGTMNRYEAGAREPAPSLLQSLARLDKSVNPAWLLTGEGQMLLDRGARSGEGADVLQRGMAGGGFITIRKLSVDLSAGPGSVVGEEEDEEADFRFAERYVREIIRADARQLVMVTVRGDSMVPTLIPSQPVMVNVAKTQERVDGIWALRRGEMTMVKRLQWRFDGSVIVTSDNPRYQPLELNLNEEQTDVDIIGRVVWYPALT